MEGIMQKKDVDSIVEDLLKEEWKGKTYKDFEEKFGEKYSHGQIERIMARYKYIIRNNNMEDESGS